MKYHLKYIIFILFFLLLLIDKINAKYIVISEISHKSIELTTNDSLIIDPSHKSKTKWYSIKPILREYDNFTNYTRRLFQFLDYYPFPGIKGISWKTGIFKKGVKTHDPPVHFT